MDRHFVGWLNVQAGLMSFNGPAALNTLPLKYC